MPGWERVEKALPHRCSSIGYACPGENVRRPSDGFWKINEDSAHVRLGTKYLCEQHPCPAANVHHRLYRAPIRGINQHLRVRTAVTWSHQHIEVRCYVGVGLEIAPEI